MSIAEFSAAVGMGPMNAANAMRRDSGLPKHERQFPFATATPPETVGGKWKYIIPRTQFEAWREGGQTQAADNEAILDQLAGVLLQQGKAMIELAKAMGRQGT